MASKKDVPPTHKGNGQTDTAVLERTKVQKPVMYRVIMHNDDYTTQEFVIHILIKFFRKEPGEAHFLMLKVHTSGQATVGVYTKEIAETKVTQVVDYAKESGFPLLVTAEPA